MWPEWDDPRACLGGRQQGKHRSGFLIWILQTKGNIRSDLAAGVLMAFFPSPPATYHLLCPTLGSFPAEVCISRTLQLQNAAHYRQGEKTFRVIKCSLDKHIYNHKSAIFISGRLLKWCPCCGHQHKGVLYLECHWGPSKRIKTLSLYRKFGSSCEYGKLKPH